MNRRFDDVRTPAAVVFVFCLLGGMIVGALLDEDRRTPGSGSASALPELTDDLDYADVLAPIWIGADPPPAGLIENVAGTAPTPSTIDDGDLTDDQRAVLDGSDLAGGIIGQPGAVLDALLMARLPEAADEAITAECGADAVCVAERTEALAAYAATAGAEFGSGVTCIAVCGADDPVAAPPQTGVVACEGDCLAGDDPVDAPSPLDIDFSGLAPWLKRPAATSGLADPCHRFDGTGAAGCDGVNAAVDGSELAALSILDVRAERNGPWMCGFGGPPSSVGEPVDTDETIPGPDVGEIVYVVHSSQPGVFSLMVTHADGTTEELQGETHAVQMFTVELGATDAVTTCILGPEPTDPFDIAAVSVSGKPFDPDTVGGSWVGSVMLPVGEPVRPADAGIRPAVQLLPQPGRVLTAQIPGRPGEATRAAVVRRNPDEPTEHRCASAWASELGPADVVPMVNSEVHEAGFGDYPFMTTARALVPAGGPQGTWDVCVEWLDQSSEGPSFERDRIPVVPPASPRYDVIPGGIEVADGLAGGSVSLAINDNCTQIAELTAGFATDEPLCSAFAVDGVARFAVVANTAVEDGAGGETRVLLTTEAGDCASPTPADCTRWFAIPLFDGDGRAGAIVVGLRPDSALAGDTWQVGSSAIGRTDDLDAAARSPLVLPDEITVELRPAGTVDGATESIARVSWRSTQPAVGLVRLRPRHGAPRCSDLVDADGVATADTEETSLGISMDVDGLCPGTLYDLELDLYDPDTGHYAHYRGADGSPVGIGEVGFVDVGVAGDPVSMDLSVDLKVLMWDLSRGLKELQTEVAPFDVDVAVDGTTVDSFHQPFVATSSGTGRAYDGIDCRFVAGLTREASVEEVEIGGGSWVRVVYHFGDITGADGSCSSSAKALGQMMARRLDALLLSSPIAVDELLREGSVTLQSEDVHFVSQEFFDPDSGQVADTAYEMRLEVVISGTVTSS